MLVVGQFERNRPLGAKAPAFFASFSARLKPCPCYKAGAKAPVHWSALIGPAEAVPFQGYFDSGIRPGGAKAEQFRLKTGLLRNKCAVDVE